MAWPECQRQGNSELIKLVELSALVRVDPETDERALISDLTNPLKEGLTQN